MEPIQSQQNYTFSYTTYCTTHAIDEKPIISALEETTETVPVHVFSQASTMQALVRYLVDTRGHSFTKVARLLHRSPKSIWSSYHQTTALKTDSTQESTIQIPLEIFQTTRAPLQALVLHLKSLGLRNTEIARMLQLDPKTTWTVANRKEALR